MTNARTPVNGSTVYQIVVDGQKSDIVANFDTAIRQIGFALAGSVEALNSWSNFPEFDGQNTAELAGTFYHRVRYAVVEQSREYRVEEHRLNGLLGARSFIRSIDLKNEFDPAFEIQSGLNYVARGLESIPTASGMVEALIASHIEIAKRTKSNADIIGSLREVQQRMGGEDFVSGNAAGGAEFLANLPKVAKARFDDLAAEMRNSIGMKM